MQNTRGTVKTSNLGQMADVQKADGDQNQVVVVVVVVA